VLASERKAAKHLDIGVENLKPSAASLASEAVKVTVNIRHSNA